MIKITEKQHDILMSIGNILYSKQIPISFNLLKRRIYIENITLLMENADELLNLLKEINGPDVDGDVVVLNLCENNISKISYAGKVVASYGLVENEGLAYLYHVNGGELRCIEVVILKEQPRSITCMNINGLFFCAGQPFTVEHNTVWMRKRDDKMAIRLLSDDAQKQIELQIKRHENYLNILIKGVKGE